MHALEQQLRRFDRNGFVTIDGALSPAEVRRLTRLTERLRRSESAAADGSLHALGFVAREPAFVELVDHPRVLELVCAILGWNIHMYHCHLDVHPPAAAPGGHWRWHQDGGRQNLEVETDPRPLLSVKVGWFLTDVARPGRGNLRVIPGSHLQNRLSRPKRPELPAAPPPGAVDVLARPGTAVVFDRRVWHARGDNTSRLTRLALFLGYTFRWIRGRDSYSVSAPWFEELSPVRRQLLGASATADGHWLPADEDVPLRAWMSERGLSPRPG
jgi:ectoine hydroxylase-related dioxygenase (phytanoyl-CoA dioxygenase family)